MSDLLHLGIGGLRTYARSLATIGDNIANAQTPGYARRTLALTELPGSGNNVLVRPNVRPGGVEIDGVVRATDVWLQTEARLASGEGARTQIQASAAEDVGAILADGQNGIASGLSQLFTTADALTDDPGSTTLRSQFLGAVDQIATGFRQVAGRLSGVASANTASAQDAVGQLNTALTSLEQVNLGLRKARDGSTQQASLLDERDRLLGQLSASLDVSASFENHGAVTLRAAGSGDLLVGNGTVQSVAMQVAPDGRIGFSVAGQALVAGSGALAGYAAAANHIADQRAQLDSLSQTVSAQLNSAHQAGLDAAGAPGRPLFAPATNAAGMFAAAMVPQDVAVASATSPTGNMLAFSGQRGVETLWGDAVANQSRVAAGFGGQYAAAMVRLDAANEAVDNVSAVDLDREAADLIRFQQAYTAAAQTIQVARETMQALFNAI